MLRRVEKRIGGGEIDKTSRDGSFRTRKTACFLRSEKGFRLSRLRTLAWAEETSSCEAEAEDRGGRWGD